MVQFSSGVCWLLVWCPGFVVCWVLLLVCGVCCCSCVVWLLLFFCLCWFWCVLVGPLFCGPPGCLCCSSWLLLLLLVFWLVVVVVLLCPLFCSWWCCGCSAVLVARVVLLCVAPSWCWLLLVRVLLVLLVLLVVVGLVVLLLRCFVDPAPGSPPLLTQNATWLGWLCGVSAPGVYASGWLCAIQLVRLLRASLVSSLPVRPSVVRVSCRYSRFSAVYLCATASRLICPSSCLFAFIVATRCSPPGVVRLSCRWQSALICSLFMLFVGYGLNVARGFFLLACLQFIQFPPFF